MCFILISKIIFTNLLQSGAVGAVLVSILSISSWRPQRVSASFSRPLLPIGVFFHGITIFAEVM
jgi:hypothetical protein